MIKTFENFLFEENEKGKFKTVDYKIIIRDLNDKPTTLITDFEIIRSENGKTEIKGKGYTYTYLDIFKKKKGWIPFDNKTDNKTLIVRHKHFENGTLKIKVYNEIH